MLHNSKKETILKEEIQENTLAIYLENEPIDYIPDRESGYTLDLTKSSCNNGVTISFDYNTWSVKTNYSNYKNNDNTRVKCSLYFTDKYMEPLLNGTDPILEDLLIPVTIDNDGTVRKADLASEWYDYETKQWANAVILEDESKSYASGDIIPEENIESYFVWIPKYRYQLWDLGTYVGRTSIDTSKVHEIPIIFGDYNTSDSVSGECTTPMESGASGNCQVGDYMTHPAFLSIPSKGFWVGKFETGYKGATNTTEAAVNERNSNKVQIKPNIYSWRGIQVVNAFYTTYEYKRELDSHMMKNTEWGAVVYLSHSAYGSATSVRMNNNSDYVTGYQANKEPTCGYTGASEECNRYCNDNTCNTAYPNSNLASTTGNITGVFDMSGGAYDGVMAVLEDQNGNPISGRNALYNSGFNGTYGCPTCDNQSNLELTTGEDFPEERYYDKYNYISQPNTFYYDRRILGDATGELGPFGVGSNDECLSSWYQVQVSFININSPWANRGNLYVAGTSAGMLAGNTNYGNGLVFGQVSDANSSFRIILTPSM